MSIDRYTKIVLTAIALALSVLAGQALLPLAQVSSTAYAQVTRSVPKEWGKVVGFMPGLIFFEAADGTLRSNSVGSGDIINRN